MKINWGTALVIFFILYIGNLARVVIKSRTIDHTLVVDNYYDHDIKYQEKVDKINNRNLLAEDLNIDYKQQEKVLRLNFGEESAVTKASLQMYRASDKNADFVKSIETGVTETNINLPDLSVGKWKVKVEWSDKDRSYLKEKDIYIQI
jgi:hypothetical protein